MTCVISWTKCVQSEAKINHFIHILPQKFYARKPEGLNGALKDLGINFEGREHSGMLKKI